MNAVEVGDGAQGTLGTMLLINVNWHGDTDPNCTVPTTHMSPTRFIERVWVVLAADDGWWRQHDWTSLGYKLETVFCGGPTRAESVANGLRAAATFLGLPVAAARQCGAIFGQNAVVAGDGDAIPRLQWCR